VCKIPGYTAHLKRTVTRNRPFRRVYTRERVRIDKKSIGGPPAHRGQPAHRRSSARVSECSSIQRSKNTDALKKPQWLDNARSKYRNTPPLIILSPSACATVDHLFPSRSLPRTRKDCTRDAGFLSPPTTTSLTTRVDTHVVGENESRSRIETLFIENRNSSKHPPIDMMRLTYPFGVDIHSRSVNLS